MPYSMCCVQRENTIGYKKYLILNLHDFFSKEGEKNKLLSPGTKVILFSKALTPKYVYQDNRLLSGKLCVEILGE